tara:strand:+ start:38 stop:181 length:144 start_codon:yes stop_codon:yes gene_type:complete
MKFSHPHDTKVFLIGLFASITAVIVWDVLKNKFNLINNKPKNKPDEN